MGSLQASPSATTRQVALSLLETADIFSIKNKKSASGYDYIPCFPLPAKRYDMRFNFMPDQNPEPLYIYCGDGI